MDESDDCCGTTVFGCFPDVGRKKNKPPSEMHKAQQQQQQHSPGGSVQAFYRQNRGNSCRKIMRFNGYPNKVSGRRNDREAKPRKGCVRT